MSMLLFLGVVAIAVVVSLRVRSNGGDPIGWVRRLWERLEGERGDQPVSLRALTKALFDSLVEPHRRLSDGTIVEKATRFVVFAAPGDAEELATELEVVEIDVNKRIAKGQREHKLRIRSPISIVEVIYDPSAAQGRPRLVSEARALERKSPGSLKGASIGGAAAHEGRRRRSADSVGTTPMRRDEAEVGTTVVYAGELVGRDGASRIVVPAGGTEFGRDDKFARAQARIADTTGRVSRVHGRIMPGRDGMTIEDMSTNGTTVNGKALAEKERRLLVEGDEVTLGGSVVLVWKPMSGYIKTTLLPGTKGRH